MRHVGSVVAVPRLWSTGSIVLARGLSCSAICGIFLDQRSNQCLLHWQPDSLPLSHQESLPEISESILIFKSLFFFLLLWVDWFNYLIFQITYIFSCISLLVPLMYFLFPSNMKRLWCWEGLGAGGKGDDRGWDGWMAALTGCTWVWVNSGSCDGQGGLACCDSWGRKEPDMTEQLNWTELNVFFHLKLHFWLSLFYIS